MLGSRVELRVCGKNKWKIRKGVVEGVVGGVAAPLRSLAEWCYLRSTGRC